MNYVVWGLQNVSTKKLVQEQDSCLKSHLPPECKRCISAVFHCTGLLLRVTGKNLLPTNYPYIKVSCLTFKMNLATCRFLCLSFLSQMSTEHTHVTSSCIFHCTIFGNVHFFLMLLRQKSPPLKSSNFFLDRFSAASSVGGFADPDIYRETDCTLQ